MMPATCSMDGGRAVGVPTTSTLVETQTNGMVPAEVGGSGAQIFSVGSVTSIPSAPTGQTSGGRGGRTTVPISALYVGDLDRNVGEADLFSKFSTVGPILSVRVCRDALRRTSLGYAYVNYSQHADAERAIETMNYEMLHGKPMRIMYSQRDPSLRRSGVGNLFIKNLDKTIDSKSLYDTFYVFGTILSCKIMYDENGNSRGYGFVHFSRAEAAASAIAQVNGMMLKTKKVFVGKFKPKEERLRELGSHERKFTNVYIKNFAQQLTDSSLADLFKAFGTTLSAKVMLDDAGVSKGFGFVSFEKPEEAEAAVRSMNGYKVGDSELYVGRAQKKSERQAELKQKSDQIRAERLSKYQGVNLYIKNLDDSIDDARLCEKFSVFGRITSSKIMYDENNRPKGFGFVCFSLPEEATRAVTEMNGRILGSKPLYVALAQKKEERRAHLQNNIFNRINSMRPGMHHMQSPYGHAAPAQMTHMPVSAGQLIASAAMQQQQQQQQQQHGHNPQAAAVAAMAAAGHSNNNAVAMMAAIAASAQQQQQQQQAAGGGGGGQPAPGTHPYLYAAQHQAAAAAAAAAAAGLNPSPFMHQQMQHASYGQPGFGPGGPGGAPHFPMYYQQQQQQPPHALQQQPQQQQMFMQQPQQQQPSNTPPYQHRRNTPSFNGGRPPFAQTQYFGSQQQQQQQQRSRFSNSIQQQQHGSSSGGGGGSRFGGNGVNMQQQQQQPNQRSMTPRSNSRSMRMGGGGGGGGRPSVPQPVMQHIPYITPTVIPANFAPAVAAVPRADLGQLQTPLPPPPALPFSIEDIKSQDEGERRKVIGDYIFGYIKRFQPGLAPKLTGMLLGLEDEGILGVIQRPELLTEKVQEALNTLSRHRTQQHQEEAMAPAGDTV